MIETVLSFDGDCSEACRVLDKEVERVMGLTKEEARRRGVRASNVLRNVALQTLSGQRNGREYYVRGTKTKYRASAPGEAPASASASPNFRLSWNVHPVEVHRAGRDYVTVAGIESGHKVGDYLLGELLENGTSGKRGMKPRPYKKVITKNAEQQILAIYNERYNI